MKELLEFIIKNLVDDPNAVYINEIQNDKITILELKVSEDDMGKIIGKQGRIAKSIRNILKAASIYNNQRVVLEIVK